MIDILKGSAVILLHKALGAASLLCIHLLIARSYGASTLGAFNLIVSLLVLGAVFSRLGLDTYVVRVLPEIMSDRAQVVGFLQKVARLLLVGSILSMLLLMSLADTIDQYIFKNMGALGYLIALALILVPFTFFTVVPEVFRGFQEINIYSFYRNLVQNGLLLLALTASLVFAEASFDPIWLLYGVVCVATIMTILHLYSYLAKNGLSLFQKAAYSKGVLAYSYPMFLTAAMMMLMGNVDSIMIGFYLDESHVGVYTACLTLALPMIFFVSVINGYIAPKIALAYSNKDHAEIKRIYLASVRIAVASSLPILLVMYASPEWLLSLFGQGFANSSDTLVIICLAYALNACFGPTGYVLNMTDNQTVFMRIMLASLLLNLALNYFLIPLYALNGAAMATLLSTVLWNILSLVFLQRRLFRNE